MQLPNQSLSSLPAFGAASADPTRLPELRHNLTLLCSTFTSSLRSLAREGAGVEQRRAYLSAEEQRMRRVVEAQERKLAQLRGVVACVERVRAIEGEAMELLRALEAQQDAQVADAEAVLGRFDDEFDRLLGDFAGEYDEMGLDEVVVGAIAPLVSHTVLSPPLPPPPGSKADCPSDAAAPPVVVVGPPLVAVLHRSTAQAIPQALPHRPRRPPRRVGQQRPARRG